MRVSTEAAANKTPGQPKILWNLFGEVLEDSFMVLLGSGHYEFVPRGTTRFRRCLLGPVRVRFAERTEQFGKQLLLLEEDIRGNGSRPGFLENPEQLRFAKSWGFSDVRLAQLSGSDEETIRQGIVDALGTA